MATFRKRLFRRRKSGVSTAADGLDGQNGHFSDFETSHSAEISGDEFCSDDDDEAEEDIENRRRKSEYDGPEMGGPTLITVDDGKGGIKHVRVAEPPDSQGEHAEKSSPERNAVALTSPTNTASTTTTTKSAPPSPGCGGRPHLDNLLKQQFNGRHFLNFDADREQLKRRIVSKRGAVHISHELDRAQKNRFILDYFNTMLDMRWRYVLLLFTLSFFLSWLGFAGIWYLILYLRRDFEPDHLPDRQEESGWTPCVFAMYDFASCFLFSVETQHTIGYGSRQTTERCPEAIFVMSFQSVVGVMIQACMVGTFFAKMSRPKKRALTVMFSKNAVVCMRDGCLCLLFRVANMRSSQLIESHTRAILVSKKVTQEGEVIPYHQTELTVGTDLEGEEETVFFIWPMTIVHRINEDSPFYNMNARDFLKKRYELIVVLEGIVEASGNTIQARTSYLPNEILWGYRFVNVLNFRRRQAEYIIDYNSFNTLYNCTDSTPTCSAKVYQERQELKNSDDDDDDDKGQQQQQNHVSLPLLPQLRIHNEESRKK